MPKQASVEELKNLPSVGETTARTLKEKGYGSFAELVQAQPTELHHTCDIVLSSTTHIISAAVDYLRGDCPTCGTSDFDPAWQEYSESIPDDDAEIICTNCNWYGMVDDINTEAEVEQ